MPRPKKAERLQETEFAESSVCADDIVHIDAIQQARAGLPRARVIGDMTALFGALGDPTRLRIVAALASQELCVCDLAATIGLHQSGISHQLRTLRKLGLVKPRREGRRVYYSLDDEHVSTLFDQALDHVRHQTEEQS